MDWVEAQQLAVALGLGLLVGFQREWTAPHVAGIRTFALITVLGALLGQLVGEAGWQPVGVGLAAVAALVIVGGVIDRTKTGNAMGLTTEAAALVMYLVGVMISCDRMVVGIVVGGGTAVLLQWKEPLHAIVHRVGVAEVRAIIQLALIALVILPVLPDSDYGPYGVLNPFDIWRMVVLIVGISLAGFIGQKVLGDRAGALLGGVLGGLISSTATTVSYARHSRLTSGGTGYAATVILIASTVVFGRVFVEVALVAPSILPSIAPPLAAMTALMIALSVVGLLLHRHDTARGVSDQVPSELRAAIAFGLLYAGVLFAVAAVKTHFGNDALYAVAALSGLTDMDAITLSVARLIDKDQLEASVGWRMIVIGSLANMVFKLGIIAILGQRALQKRVAALLGVGIIGGVLVLVFWPS